MAIRKLADSYDPEALDQALADLVASAQTSRDCFLMGDHDLGRIHFQQAIHFLSEGVHQISLLNRK